MPVEKDYYTLLKVPRNASSEQIRRAFREAAHRLHPDKNVQLGETELFLEVSKAYETLIDDDHRAAYDEELAAADIAFAAASPFRCNVLNSRNHLLKINEPQVHYLLLDIFPAEDLPEIRPSINLSIVIDRSTSMSGKRMDKVRAAVLAILEDLKPEDNTSITAFSDRAEVIVSPDQAKAIATARARLSLLQAGGGTEIAQGLTTGLDVIHQTFSKEGVNHLILLTDGRTYGDEELCLELADQAAAAGITINCVGIGSDWSDRLLDEIASRTGGHVTFLNTPQAVADLLHSIYDSLSQIVASKLRIDGALGQQVDLRSAYRLLPEPMPLGDNFPMTLGHLPRHGSIRLLLELVIHPLSGAEEIALAHLHVSGDLLGVDSETKTLPIDINLPVSSETDSKPPPKEISSALNMLALYKIQEKARHEVELGQSAQAARRLENLATQLLAAGERDLARAALNEAVQLSRSRRFSTEGEKTLKYGTRALLLLPPSSES
ncbi:MAG: VWA domain-containing protein [Anaerolineales bacterium]